MSHRYRAVAQSSTRTLLAGHRTSSSRRGPACVRCRYNSTDSVGIRGVIRASPKKRPKPVRVLRGEGKEEREGAIPGFSHGRTTDSKAQCATYALEWTGADRVPLSGGHNNQLTVRSVARGVRSVLFRLVRATIYPHKSVASGDQNEFVSTGWTAGLPILGCS